MRSAMSPERAALPFSRLDRAGRETRSAIAAAVTDRPAGWMISVRMKSPGWHGFFIGIAFLLIVLVVVLQVHVVDFAPSDIDAERQTAVTANAEAPSALPVADQSVCFPRWERVQFHRVLHVIEKRQHFAELVYRLGRNAFCYVRRVECLQTLVDEASYLHLTDCSLTLNTCQLDSAGASETEPSLSKRRLVARAATQGKSGPSSSPNTPNIHNHLNKLALTTVQPPRSVALLPHTEVVPS